MVYNWFLGALPLQECRQFKVQIKDQEENRKEDWVTKGFEAKDDGTSSSSDSPPKKRKQARHSWAWVGQESVYACHAYVGCMHVHKHSAVQS